MEVILLENIGNLGNLGDKVDVKSGYGRNFLIPQGKAVPADMDDANALQFVACGRPLPTAAIRSMPNARRRSCSILKVT